MDFITEMILIVFVLPIVLLVLIFAIKSYISNKEYNQSELGRSLQNGTYNPTSNLELKKMITIDEVNHLFTFGNPSDIYKYEQLVSCSMDETYDTAHNEVISIYVTAVVNPGAKLLVVRTLWGNTPKGSIYYSTSDYRAKTIYSMLKSIEKYNEQHNTQNSPTLSTADEIGKYKALLDNGAITEEEYECKKKQILNL